MSADIEREALGVSSREVRKRPVRDSGTAREGRLPGAEVIGSDTGHVAAHLGLIVPEILKLYTATR